MALLPTSVPSLSPQSPLCNSPNTSAQPNTHSTQQVSATHDAADIPEKKPDIGETLQDLDTSDYTEKYRKYEADYVRRLNAKYFSKKSLYGGNIFDKETTIENEIIKSSRWPCTRSFTDPVQSFEDQSKSPASTAETSTNLPNRKSQCKKSSS